MTLFTIDQEGKISEFNEKKREDQKKKLDLVSMIEKNPDSVFQSDTALIIGQKVPAGTKHVIDFLGIDQSGNTVIIDVQGMKASKKSIIGLLEKSVYIDSMDENDLKVIYKGYVKKGNLTKAHSTYFGAVTDSIAWNSCVRLVLVAQSYTEELIKTAKFLRKNGLAISCVSFRPVVNKNNLNMVSREFVVGGSEIQKPDRAIEYIEPKTDKEKFFYALDDTGQSVFTQLYNFAEHEGLEFNWTNQGLSLNVIVDNESIPICYGYTYESLLGQSIYAGFDQIQKKVNYADKIVALYQETIEGIDQFRKTRSSYRWEISEESNTESTMQFIDLLQEISHMIKENGLIEIEADTPVL